MASYLDQIPKQLAARRKAFLAARANPALMPSFWAIVRSITSNIYIHMQNIVVDGSTSPDRPIQITADDACFLDFGTTPGLLYRDAAWIEADFTGRPPPDAEAMPSASSAALVRSKLAALARCLGDDFGVTRVYNLASWLQAVYREKLDVDDAQDLQRRVDARNAFMDTVPVALASTGLDAETLRRVVEAFHLFKTIMDSAHQLDRQKMSIIDRRSFVTTQERVERAIKGADDALGIVPGGRSVVREQFALWKEANYETVRLSRELGELWAGASLEEHVQELSNILTAMQKTINRCSDEARKPAPQLPLFRADTPVGAMVDHATVVDEFHSLILHDLVGESPLLQGRELRRFGPLAVVMVPGGGEPRYSGEVRRTVAAELDAPRRGKAASRQRKRDADAERRVRYPLNCVAVPVEARRKYLRRNLADAWLEYNLWAFPAAFRNFLENIRIAVPEIFLPPSNSAGGPPSPVRVRRRLAKLIAAFVGWSRNGEHPSADELPEFVPFRRLALGRLDSRAFVLPPHIRPLVQLFTLAGTKRRLVMWRRHLGPRAALDQQLVAALTVLRDWNALRDSLKFLPTEIIRGNSSLATAFAKLGEAADPFARDKAAAHFRNFLATHPDLKAALMVVEARMVNGVEALRNQAEDLGDEFSVEQATEKTLREQVSRIRQQRIDADKHIDHYLIGMMYAVSGNFEAAEATLSMCLDPEPRSDHTSTETSGIPDEVDEDWFSARLKQPVDTFKQLPVPGQNAPGVISRDYVHYNLGLIYLRRARYLEATLSFQGVLDTEPADRAHLVREWAAKHREAAAEKVLSAMGNTENPAPASAAETWNGFFIAGDHPASVK